MLNWLKRRAAKPRKGGKVLLLIDWDNLKACLQETFGPGKMRIDQRIRQMMNWVRDEIGEVLEGYGFVFAPEHLIKPEQELCVSLGLRLMTCPKKQIAKPARNPKTHKMETEIDTVDETLMWFGKMMLHHPDVGFICLVSGDKDYEPLLKRARSRGVKVALIAPTINSLSNKGGLVRLADRNPSTSRFMFLRLDTLVLEEIPKVPWLENTST